VKGDTATIIGKNKAFVYGGKDVTDAGKPFLTLYPGDRYNLASRRVVRRASDGSPVTAKFVDSLFRKYSDQSLGGATVLVAQDGSVLIDRSYGIPDQAKYMPTTTVPQFPVGGITEVFYALCAQLPEPPAGRGGAARDSVGRGRGRGANTNTQTPFQNCITRRVSTPVGLHKTTATPDGQVQSNVDELYRVALGLENPRTFVRDTTSGGAIDLNKSWEADAYRGVSRFSAFGAPDGKRAAFVRIPDKHATIIVLTNDDRADAKGIADKLTDRLLFSKPQKQ
jgi:hypothetical protein